MTAANGCLCAVVPRGAANLLPKPLLSKLHGLRAQCAYTDAASALRLADLEYVADLGAGQFGTVVLMRDNRHKGGPVALKLIVRSQYTKRADRQKRLLLEKQIMLELRHPFIVRLVATFKSAELLMMAMESIMGGDLFQAIDELGGALSDAHAHFLFGCLVLMLEHVHSRAFIFRDLKPENVMIGADGYPKLIDFGMCKRLLPSERAFTACGTPEYIAPEVITKRAGYGAEADWWSAGVMLFEMSHGYTPFTDGGTVDSENKVLANIASADYTLEYEAGTPLANAVTRGLLHRSWSERFGSAELRAHAYFGGFDWQALLAKQLPSPYVPAVKDPFDMRNFDPEIDEGNSGPELLALAAAPPTGDAADSWDADF